MLPVSPGRKLEALDGLRGIAAVIVVLNHLRLAFFIDSGERLTVWLLAHSWRGVTIWRDLVEGFFNGTLAVWVFWVMSAFVLSLQFFVRAREESGLRAHDYLEDAALRRYPRLLLPVLASIVLAYGLHAAGAMSNLRLAQLRGVGYDPGCLSEWYRFPPDFFAAMQSAFWGTFFDYDASQTYNGVLWSMEPEFFGSLFLFAFLALFGHRRCRFVLYPVAAVCIWNMQLLWLEAFLGGIFLCDLFVNGRRSIEWPRPVALPFRWARDNSFMAGGIWLGLLLLAGRNPRREYLVGLACFIVAFALTSTGTKRLLTSPVPVFLGKISFGLYLVHIPIMMSFSCWLYLSLEPACGLTFTLVGVGVTTLALSIWMGYLFYRWVDRPSITLSRWLSTCVLSGGLSPKLRSPVASKSASVVS